MEFRDVERDSAPSVPCEDCGKPINEAGGFATYDGGKYKCDTCYSADPFLRPRCEVYSRVAGYLRPVENWNLAKQAEFADRRMMRPDSWD